MRSLKIQTLDTIATAEVDDHDQRLGHAQRADLQGGLLEHGTDGAGREQRRDRPVSQHASGPDATSTSVVASMNAAIKARVILSTTPVYQE